MAKAAKKADTGAAGTSGGDPSTQKADAAYREELRKTLGGYPPRPDGKPREVYVWTYGTHRVATANPPNVDGAVLLYHERID